MIAMGVTAKRRRSAMGPRFTPWGFSVQDQIRNTYSTVKTITENTSKNPKGPA